MLLFCYLQRDWRAKINHLLLEQNRKLKIKNSAVALKNDGFFIVYAIGGISYLLPFFFETNILYSSDKKVSFDVLKIWAVKKQYLV